jgi:hypothetical protein
MGYGDQLMAAGQAQTIFDADRSRGPILLVDITGRPRWNPVWLHNPAVAVPGTEPGLRQLVTGRDALPYIVNPYSLDTGWRWTDWRAQDHRGRLYLTGDERVHGYRLRKWHGPFILLEPTAERKHVNRRPPREFWERLAMRLAHVTRLPIVQLAHADAERLPHIVDYVAHATFREACGILQSAAVLVSTEGGLPHAAAALGVRAVVLWGGNVSCANLGYPEHENLVDDQPGTPCGMLKSCDHCARAWVRLSVDRVADAVQREVMAHGLP